MAHEIESEYVEDFENEEKQCKNCTAFSIDDNGVGYCSEAKAEISATGHCNFFQSIY